MSKKLYLLRHAQASSSLNGEDKDRLLTEHGQTQAKNVGWCLDPIKATICSSAERTRMTLDSLKEANEDVGKIEFSDALYNASSETILKIIQAQTEDSVLIIAHNPGIHELASSLAGDGDTVLLDKLSMFYNPGTLAVLDCPIERWADLAPKKNTLEDLIIPD